MKVAIAGGSGFIGTALTERLTSEGHSVFILTRDKSNKSEKAGVRFVEWLKDGTTPEEELDGIDAFVNLAGENLNSGRWTDEKKKQIMDSRIEATRAVMDVIRKLELKPEVLVNASAVGYYGTSFTETFTEEHKESGDDFLAEVVKRWEEEASHAQKENVRVAYMRFGVVLDDEEGALQKMLTPFKLFAGGPLGTGKQWMSWVHIDDVVGSIVYAIEHREISGPVNVTAPNPVQMKEFGKTLADVLDRPYWLPAPSIALKTILGDMSVLVLEGQKVLPDKLEKHDYPFEYRELKPALQDLLV
ncbi:MULTISPECIES: TIGR01777 family oxidoreductase [Alteribacter]|uniref:TIGR01777 family protein n=1 Tax=Alteribacter keqinensis TaxID=2483800 RepID=A0A3M7TNM4_9BACI|nr:MULTISPECIES: TIGR01777 family oxidoreductase [Alteribacter]MBM7097733.1 TIGR01777 family oxidoreductase [Alteribacter salitolerans]RNA67135.1 TIGR01777 family protein [Alteribacter keqinensis]